MALLLKDLMFQIAKVLLLLQMALFFSLDALVILFLLMALIPLHHEFVFLALCWLDSLRQIHNWRLNGLK